MANTIQYRGTGRRKTSVAQVRLIPGEGKVLINKRPLNEYFGKKTLEMVAKQPLVLTKNEGRYDVVATVRGGGVTGQAGAIRLGVARALLKADIELRPRFEKSRFPHPGSPDERKKEYGLKGARRAPQFSKR